MFLKYFRFLSKCTVSRYMMLSGNWRLWVVNRPTSCCAPTSPATSVAGPTTSPTPSWPAGSRCRRCCRWRRTPSGSTVLQGVPPQLAHRGHRRRGRASLAAGRRRRLRAARPGPAARRSTTGAGTDPAPVPHCEQCRWSAHCTTGGLRRPTTSSSSPACAATTGTPCVAVGHPDARGAGERRRDRAGPGTSADRPRAAAAAGAPAAERADHRPGRRTAARPQSPAAGCCACRRRAPATSTSTSRATRAPTTAQGREYLAGLGDPQRRFTALWAHDHDRGGGADRRPVDRLTRRLARRPGACTSTTTRPTRRPRSSG